MEGSLAPSDQVTLTPSAARRVAQLAAQQGDAGLMLRLKVSGGGCSGFQYGFDLDAARNADDRVFESEGATLVVDEVSLPLVAGARVDFVEDLAGSFFKVENPNAASSCGCGTSFAI